MAEADGAAAGAAGAATPHYEYLDHTADIQVHSWGKDLQESFANQVVAMFGYMTELDKVDIDEACTVEFEVEGEDACSLLYTLLDEFLFRFSAEDFMVCKEVRVLEFDAENWRMKVQGKGEAFDLTKHPQGTEVKAITYSAMQVHANKSTHDVYVILDI